MWHLQDINFNTNELLRISEKSKENLSLLREVRVCFMDGSL